MKKFLILITICALLVGCTTKTNEVEQNSAEVTNTPEVTEAIKTAEPTPEPAVMPSLPDKDFSGMDFFDDGYQVVEYISLSDGDTAVFVVGDKTYSCRFLAIDTPEMNSSTDGMQPWAQAAKNYTKDKLENATEIILEMDIESDIFDDYDRLLAWVWVDGQLLNYKLVEEGLASVKYLYGDYIYTPNMIKIESQTQKTKIKIWGEDDPDFDYEKKTVDATILDARNMVTGSNVKVTGIVTALIDKNAFIQDDTGAIYIYANKYNYSALEVGNEVTLEGKVLDYNGLLEISNVVDKKITAISENNVVEPKEITLDQIGEDIESQYVKLTGLTIKEVQYTDDGAGYNIIVTQNDLAGVIRVDKYLKSYPDPEKLNEGDVISVVGNVGQYLETYQIMISNEADVTYE